MAPKQTTSKTKEELLVENAILKNNEQVRTLLKAELAPFSEAIKNLDKRLDIVESDVVSLKDVVAPFSAIRNRLWFWVIAVSLTVAIVGNNLNELFNKYIIK